MIALRGDNNDRDSPNGGRCGPPVEGDAVPVVRVRSGGGTGE